MDNQVKKHHHLISGAVHFRNKDSNDIGSVPLNGVLLSDNKDIPMTSLGKAQKVLQLNFYRNAQADGKVEVVDVVLLNLVYLGEFTEAEFKAVPEGLSLQEVKTALSEATGAVVASNDGDAVQQQPAAEDPVAPAVEEAPAEKPGLTLVKSDVADSPDAASDE